MRHSPGKCGPIDSGVSNRVPSGDGASTHELGKELAVLPPQTPDAPVGYEMCSMSELYYANRRDSQAGLQHHLSHIHIIDDGDTRVIAGRSIHCTCALDIRTPINIWNAPRWILFLRSVCTSHLT
jgi:hypothetical protein